MLYGWFVVLSLFLEISSAQNCLDENGDFVDWWASIKAPHSSGPLGSIQAGFAVAYMDSNTKSKSLSMSSNSIDSPNSALARTLNDLYNKAINPETGYVFYNDETPISSGGSVSSSGGHAKGVFGFSSSSSFWLLHSVPKGFDAPNNTASDEFSYPSNGVNYGQSFICLSLNKDTLDTVGRQLQYYEPQIYGSHMPDSLADQFPYLTQLINGTTINQAGSQIEELLTVGGTRITHFAKNEEWGKELYSELVAPYFKVGLFSETWMRPKEASVYPPSVPYSLVDILSVSLPSDELKTYKYTTDHSKWVISQDPSVPIVCIGGINHQKSQNKRGGGTACLKDENLYAAFSVIINSTDPLTP